MAEKKYLDLAGLTQYTGKIKGYADNAAKTEAGKVETGIRTDYKVKDVDTTVNDKVSLTLNTVTGKVGVTVDANVVKDSEYSTVKANANNSAAAWTKFLKDSESVYPNNITPALKDLATTSAVTSAIATAKSEAISEARELDTALEGNITTAYQGADTTLKNTLIGTKDQAGDTIWGAKKYADEKAATAKAAADAAQAAADAAQSTADTAVANAATAQTAAEAADAKAVAAQSTANSAVASIKTINETTIPNLRTDLNGNINTAKAALIGTEGVDGTTIWGAKKYAKDLTDTLSTRIDSIVSGGVAFKGVVSAMPSDPKNGDLVIIGNEGGITVGSVTYKKDYEYIYSEGAWYELGDSDKNAKAIAAVKSTADGNTTAIQRVEREYKAADSNLSSAIDTLDKAAVKKITGGKSTYVTVTAGAKDSAGNVTLTVSDSIATTFETISNVTSKISTAKNELIGTQNQDGNTILGAKKYTDDAISTLENSFVAISESEINALFA